MKTHDRCWHRWRDRRAHTSFERYTISMPIRVLWTPRNISAALVFHKAEAHMETARRFITTIRRGDFECWSSSIPRGMMAGAVIAALATCVLFFAPAVFAQPAS